MKYFALVIAFFIVQFSFADAWTEMTKSEAEAVVAELNKNPYIFDYCDCCDHDGEYATSVYLIKVNKTEIIPCEMDENCYFVQTEGEVIAEVLYNENGPDVSKLTPVEWSESSHRVCMNYTWTFNPNIKKATPFFKVVPYNYYDFEKTSCENDFAYPTPNQLKVVSKDKGYKKWYKKNF